MNRRIHARQAASVRRLCSGGHGRLPGRGRTAEAGASGVGRTQEPPVWRWPRRHTGPRRSSRQSRAEDSAFLWRAQECDRTHTVTVPARGQCPYTVALEWPRGRRLLPVNVGKRGQQLDRRRRAARGGGRSDPPGAGVRVAGAPHPLERLRLRARGPLTPHRLLQSRRDQSGRQYRPARAEAVQVDISAADPRYTFSN
jgi:hypothetical protein